ncbi:DUF1573 domain-containing protein [Niabella drilacis]|uniref:DUF1573 domain-containing protein n=1 Tax=Niabella drilacis (strain DSM 25811 / CCM 8410 / CCUG 62505 / LMG 26954 / E90) TaxID=1285928 RepID=A0A1G6I133_NIADE|nr:DUF1573 domain-containing protein [Niabella drilacis]SDC00160.1 Protein of unknown function [Niabella drilacis]
MKQFYLLAVLFFMGLAVTANAQEAVPADKVIKMAKEEYNVGKLKFKKGTSFFMEFTNISKKPVIVESVLVGCGCTVAEKPSAPVMPGKVGKIKVGYDATAAAGSTFKKDVTIKIKGAQPKTVYFTGEII